MLVRYDNGNVKSKCQRLSLILSKTTLLKNWFQTLWQKCAFSVKSISRNFSRENEFKRGRILTWIWPSVFTCRVCMHDRLHIITREAQLIAEKEWANEGQLLKFGQSNWISQKLPFWLKGEKFVNEFFGVS